MYNESLLFTFQCAIILLFDENRFVFHLLLSFLNDMSKHLKTNSISSINFATCFTLTLFLFDNFNRISSIDMPDLREI
ncbi:unnamed protein product [Rotaria sordida]|uniref:Rho-GAP domain-containing protein n=1 Tax=Rotaria sordida TaxID=392033 RepID=A0A819SUF3_9BILA|nr:unnamed protein product [Rotaria sordida]CAF4068224.1 unnamed protein product [Rotaria sordida]